VRYYYGGVAPAVGDVVPLLRGIGGLQSDRFALGELGGPTATTASFQVEAVATVHSGSPTTVDLLGSTSGVPCIEQYSPTVGDLALIGENIGPIPGSPSWGTTGKAAIGNFGTATYNATAAITASFGLTGAGTVAVATASIVGSFSLTGTGTVVAPLGRAGAPAAYDSTANMTYLIDGYVGSVIKTVVGYTYTTNTWQYLASDSVGRWVLGAAYDSSANLTYAIDGLGSSSYLSTVNAYSNGSNAWTSEASDGYGIRGYIGAAYDSSANLTYAIDGYTGTYNDAVYAYSEGSNAWTAEANDSFGVRGRIGAAYDSSANLTYAIDGEYTGGITTNATTAYSHASNAWTTETGDSYQPYGPGVAYDSSANLTHRMSGYSLTQVTAYSHGSNAWTTKASVTYFTTIYPGAAYDSSANLTYLLDGNSEGIAGTNYLQIYSHGSNAWTLGEGNP
jgi:hypothetical protein